jgi:hypothetical protein
MPRPLSSPVLLRTNESQVSDRIVSVYRGWDTFERSHGGPDIIDFDLSQSESSVSFNSRSQILTALHELRDQLSTGAPEEEFLRTRLQGSILFVRALMGEQIPFAKYVKETLGVHPEPFSSAEIQDARRELEEHLAPFDLQVKSECRERFETSLLIHDPEAIWDGIIGDQELWLARLRAAGIPVPKKLHLKVEVAKVDAYWSNWISGSLREGITLKINIHPRKEYDLGRPLALCLHEICGHAAQMSIWRELIREGALDPACGVTVVHAPEALVSEGIGQTVSDVFGDQEQFPPIFRLSRALQYYTLLVLHNAHLLIYEGLPIEDVLEYARGHLPLANPGMLESELRDRGTNPLFKTYQLSYAIGESIIRRMIRGLSILQRQRFFLKLYTTPLTPGLLLELGETLASK